MSRRSSRRSRVGRKESVCCLQAWTLVWLRKSRESMVAQKEDDKRGGRGGRKDHCGPEQPRIQTEVLCHSLVRSPVRSHCSHICLLCLAQFTRGLHCAYLFTCPLFSLTSSLDGQSMIRWPFVLCFFLFQTIVQRRCCRRTNMTKYGLGRARERSRSLHVVIF